MSTSDSDGPGTSTPCHSDRVPNSEVCGSAANLLDQRGGAVLALAQHRRVSRCRIASAAARAARIRRKPQGSSAGGPRSAGDLVELFGRSRAVATGRGRCPAT